MISMSDGREINCQPFSIYLGAIANKKVRGRHSQKYAEWKRRKSFPYTEMTPFVGRVVE
jgi:hypothetical protein